MKILAIDDSPTLRKFITKHLAAYSSHYQVLTAATAQEGVDLAQKEKPDLILLDFILPDFNGDEVCQRLLGNEDTESIPVILMSSSAPDIEKTEGKFKNIVRSMIKPFSPQLLCAGVSFVLKKDDKEESGAAPAEAKASPAVAPAPATQKTADENKGEIVLFRGRSDYFDLFDALSGIEAEKATGILKLKLESGEIECYIKNGRPYLVTTRNVDTYIAGGKLDIPEESRDYFDSLKKNQEDSGDPVFLQMGRDQSIPVEQASALVAQYGKFVFTAAWTEPAFRFDFIKEETFPDFVPTDPVCATMGEWATETLRSVNAHHPAVNSAWKPEDILSFTATGYRNIQSLSLSEEEVAFASQLGEGGATLGTIAENLNLEWHEVSRILFLFIRTRVMDVWPGAS